MGFPFEEATWDAAPEAIFMGYGTALPGMFTVIAIIICIAALVIGQASEAKKYKDHK